MTLLNSPIKIALIAILFVAYADQSTAESWAFLNPQSNCKIRCENGGVCAFQIQNPDVHKCICFVGMYFGDRCQHRTDEPTLTTTPEVVEYTTISTLAPSQAQVREEEDYTSEWKDFNNQILPDESLEEHWTEEDESAEGEDLGEEDRVAEQEYRYGQAVSNGDAEYKEYYHHPRQVQETQHAQTSYEFEAATVSTTTERWASANEPAESQEYVNDDGSEEEGWMMVKRRKTPLNSAPCMSQISLVVAVFIIFNH
ncbi:hypothetical protein L596_019035 [Steinernema carpocapsae]|uniref:EGF-like domain-containing protein n=1 Tax=Steinernema carpocapsae TaxID=34508 RepID=A0A4V6A280_STECR|nr:hypothetical protein L596_019035 [Steinernema carpocapsae]